MPRGASVARPAAAAADAAGPHLVAAEVRRRVQRLARRALPAAALALSALCGGYDVDRVVGAASFLLGDDDDAEVVRVSPSATRQVAIVELEDYIPASAAAWALGVRGWGASTVAPVASPLPLNPAAEEVLANASECVDRLRGAGLPIASYAAGKFSVWSGEARRQGNRHVLTRDPLYMGTWCSKSMDRLRTHATASLFSGYVPRDGRTYHGGNARLVATIVMGVTDGVDHQFSALALEHRMHNELSTIARMLDNEVAGPHRAGRTAADSTHGAVYLQLYV